MASGYQVGAADRIYPMWTLSRLMPFPVPPVCWFPVCDSNVGFHRVRSASYHCTNREQRLRNPLRSGVSEFFLLKQAYRNFAKFCQPICLAYLAILVSLWVHGGRSDVTSASAGSTSLTNGIKRSLSRFRPSSTRVCDTCNNIHVPSGYARVLTRSKKCAGLGEIRFEWNKVQYRPIGFASGEMEFTLVFVAQEHGKRFVPPTTCQISQNRKAEVLANRKRARVCDFD